MWRRGLLSCADGSDVGQNQLNFLSSFSNPAASPNDWERLQQRQMPQPRRYHTRFSVVEVPKAHAGASREQFCWLRPGASRAVARSPMGAQDQPPAASNRAKSRKNRPLWAG